MYIDCPKLAISNTTIGLLKICMSAYSLLSFQNEISFCLTKASKLGEKKISTFIPLSKFPVPLNFFNSAQAPTHGLWRSTGAISLPFQNIPILMSFLPHCCQIITVFLNIHFSPRTFKKKNREFTHTVTYPKSSKHWCTLYAKSVFPG